MQFSSLILIYREMLAFSDTKQIQVLKNNK